ncbi:hypothetical protein DFS33DRAFT_999203 [Desarmillaria ectypa]|nr:hypothetical protein DFS33DRAFT_999203 [Desarmillaria ectypa]
MSISQRNRYHWSSFPCLSHPIPLTNIMSDGDICNIFSHLCPSLEPIFVGILTALIKTAREKDPGNKDLSGIERPEDKTATINVTFILVSYSSVEQHSHSALLRGTNIPTAYPLFLISPKAFVFSWSTMRRTAVSPRCSAPMLVLIRCSKPLSLSDGSILNSATAPGSGESVRVRNTHVGSDNLYSFSLLCSCTLLWVASICPPLQTMNVSVVSDCQLLIEMSLGHMH